MRTTDYYRPEEVELSPFQSSVKQALDRIAALEPEPDCCVSEVALVVMSAAPGDVQDWRNLYRTAFELLGDRGYCRREHVHWRFKRRFGAADVVGVLAWRGKWKSNRVEQVAINR